MLVDASNVLCHLELLHAVGVGEGGGHAVGVRTVLGVGGAVISIGGGDGAGSAGEPNFIAPSMKWLLNSGHVLFWLANPFHSSTARGKRCVDWLAMSALLIIWALM